MNEKTFTELNFKERQNLQEWIDKCPNVLGEDLLIIQKEFSGFSETNERLDLLALDKNGNLVIIENKLDDSGRDVVWQSLKYASYCSQLSKSDIKEIYQHYLVSKNLSQTAEERILEFLDSSEYEELQLNTNRNQRIILVAANFRKEVTSTVMWLSDYGIDIKCIKVTPYQNEDSLFLDTNQIFPTPDTKELVIKYNKKLQEESAITNKQEERHRLRLEFWEKAIPVIRKYTELYQNISPTKDNWIAGASGYSGVGFNSVIKYDSVRVEIYIDRANREVNKGLFDFLYENKVEIEKELKFPLKWDRLNEKRACRISYELLNVGLLNEEKWPEIARFMGENIEKIRIVFNPYLKEKITNIANTKNE